MKAKYIVLVADLVVMAYKKFSGIFVSNIGMFGADLLLGPNICDKIKIRSAHNLSIDFLSSWQTFSKIDKGQFVTFNP